MSSGSNLDEWTDISGNGRHMAPQFGGYFMQAGPTFNGQPSVRVNKAAYQGMVSSAGAGGGTMNNFISASAFTFMAAVAVVDVNSASGAAYVFPAIMGHGNGYCGLIVRAGTPAQTEGYVYDGADHLSGTINVSAGVHVYALWLDGGVLYHQIDSGTAVSGAAPNVGSLATYPLLFAAGADLGADYCEAAIINTALDATARGNMRDYMVARYGIV